MAIQRNIPTSVSPQSPSIDNTEVQPFLWRIIAKILAVVFHPLFIPTYIFLWMYLRFPYEYPDMTPHSFKLRLIGVFWTTAFFPAFVVFILSRLKAVDSIRLKTSKERIIPYITTMFFYWWMWYLSRNFEDQALALKFFYFGIFLATVPGLILNNFFKISLHGLAIGGALAAVLLSCHLYGVYLGWDILVAIFIAGLVMTSRLVLKEHNNLEIYAGFLTGAACQFIAYWVMV